MVVGLFGRSGRIPRALGFFVEPFPLRGGWDEEENMPSKVVRRGKLSPFSANVCERTSNVELPARACEIPRELGVMPVEGGVWDASHNR